MQSRGLLPIRRSIDETPRQNDLPRDLLVNGDVTRNDPPLSTDREARENRHRHRYEENDRAERPRRGNVQRKRVEYFNNTYPQDLRTDIHVHHTNETTKSRRSRRREYEDTDYDSADAWKRDLLATAGPSDSKSILRNNINQGSDERPHYSTLPRRSRTINFEDQAYSFSGGRQRMYPKSLQNLTDLELDDVVCLPSSRGERACREAKLDDYRRRSRNQRGEELSFDDSYLRLCRNLSRLDKYPRGDRYEPGQVHYERECRTFGKDTVAFIYYKTCYL
ncbi:hypothetical protein X777_09455 [Ooceraea biroi]|uniref:Uncharacterized protein n=1 Tax=Ooceraea biroi TaxID=2015173 RepID=A0A026W9K5_OOCBI|nr:hypothetical protein X777_09455 [Ooceraea biroi]